jgi:D-cysteine desulfhydrase family pyridoxal phosphate-dependent enzyme
MNVNYTNRVSLAHLPTPVEPLPHLSRFLGGPQLFIKRDDQTGLATGGNKVRKLEFLAADALGQGCDHLITTGGPQSNHCRQTAAAAARLGLGCSLVLRGDSPAEMNGNLLLDRLLGARLCWTGGRPVDEVMDEVAGKLKANGHNPYPIPLGGSTAVGATGYVRAMEELSSQLAEKDLAVDWIVVASSSAGTQAGLTLGAQVYGFEGRILGISIDHSAAELQDQVADLAAATAAHLGLDQAVGRSDVQVNDSYLGGGYGVMGELEREAIHLLARLEGILLDPVYTGRAMGGLIDLIRQGAFDPDQRVLFWHTGGSPALFAYAGQLL